MSNKKLTKKDSSESDKTSKSDGSNKEFEILKYNSGRSTNLIKFKETAFNFIAKELGHVAKIIKDGRRFTPPLIPSPGVVFTANNDPNGALFSLSNIKPRRCHF